MTFKLDAIGSCPAVSPKYVPPASDATTPRTAPPPVHEAAHSDQFVERRAGAPRRVDGTSSFDRSSHDGTPLWAQGHGQPWSQLRMGSHGRTVGQAGCALTSAAMAVSRISHHTIRPDQLHAYVTRHHGFTSGGGLNFDVAAQAAGLHQRRVRFDPATMNRELDAGRPVVLHVPHDGTSHFVAVTRRERDAQGQSRYFANDPAGGREIELTLRNGRLYGPRHYVSTDMHVFQP